MKTNDNDDIRSEYRREDFDKMTRGKYAERMGNTVDVVVLDPDVAKVFQSAEAVNNVLRGLIEIAKRSTMPS